MSSNKCAKCDLTVYPVEGLRCLDKIWHKGCFKCHECNMTLNMKNYKGFEKRPYCNAHCPQAKATTVADTPEIRRLAENTRIQSQAKYHEDFEKSKGKGFTTIADDPESRRVKETSKIISNVAYHGEIEKKKQMEKMRNSAGQDDLLPNRINNNNLDYQQNRMHHNNHHSQSDIDFSPSNQGKLMLNPAQQRQMQQQLQQQQQRQQQQQQLVHKQQQQQILLKQHQQQEYIQTHNGQANMIGRNNPGQYDHQMVPRQMQPQQQPQHYPMNLNQQQQQQLLLRQQQHQQHSMMQQQHVMQHRQSIDPNVQMGRQPSKQAINNGSHIQPHLMKHQPIIQGQQPMMKYVPVGDAMGAHNQSMPHHLVNTVPGSDRMLDPPASGGGQNANNQRVGPALVGVSPQTPSLNHHHHNQQQQMVHHAGSYNAAHQINGPLMPPTANQQMHMAKVQQHHHQSMPHSGNQVNAQQVRPIPAQLQQGMQQMQLGQQVPRRVFRAMYDYVANDVDEVTFYENDILIDCVNVDRNWLIGRVARTGQTGMLPANYVSELPG